jgi:integron integrase
MDDHHDSPAAGPSQRLLPALCEAIRVRRYSLRTEQAYVGWVPRFVHFHGLRHPRELGAPEVEAFLTHLASQRNVSSSTQDQAKSALLFLYKHVLGIELPWMDEVVSAKASRRLPVVLTPREVRELLLNLGGGTTGLVIALLYGTGMRLLEGLRLRVKDVEFERREIIVREGKGGKDRVTVLPENLIVPLRGQLELAREWHRKDAAAGRAGVSLPDALALKYRRAGMSWGWQ